MLFNPSDKSNSLIADIDFLLFGTSSIFNDTYSLVDRTRNLNLAYDEVVAELFKADPNYMWDDTTNADFPIATIDLLAGQDNYIFPDSSLVIHRVRIKDSNGVYQTLTPGSRRQTSDSDIDNLGSAVSYYKIDNGVFLTPVPNYSAEDGLELEFQRAGTHFSTTDTDKAPGFATQFHQFLSICASLRYAIANGMPEKTNMLGQYKKDLLLKIQEHYERRSPDERPRMRLRRNYQGTGL